MRSVYDLENLEFRNIFEFIFKLERQLLLVDNKESRVKFANCLDIKSSAIFLGKSPPGTAVDSATSEHQRDREQEDER